MKNRGKRKMSDYIFLFDLDSTISQIEILPEIAKYVGKEKEIRELTERTMQGELPFKRSFMERVEILSRTSVEEVNEMIANIPLNEGIARFIKENNDRCYVVTGNLDVWISGLMKKLGMKNHCFCSKAIVKDDHIEKVVSVLDKQLTVSQFVQPIVAIGDGDNDAEMAQLSDIGIGFGGVRNIAKSLLENIDFAFYDDETVYKFLNKLL